jgi:hypothetical protein
VLYIEDVYACRYSFDKIYPWLEDYQHRSDYWVIDPVQFEMDQDSIISLDIYLGGYVNTETVKKEEEHVLKIYPNPVIEKSFHYETALPVKSTNSAIEITGLNGQKAGCYPIFESKGNIELPSDIVRGIYTVSLIVNQKNYATVKIIVP